jgi:ketosteroid isomerase-like protein
MAEVDEFLAETVPRQLEAEIALHNGDVAPRLGMWSTNDPVTLFGAYGVAKRGPQEVTQTFRWLAARFSDLADYDFELVAAGASGDLAYTVGYERHSVSIEGGPVKPHTIRATHVYRREDGEWKIVHRHGDEVPLRDIPKQPGPA